MGLGLGDEVPFVIVLGPHAAVGAAGGIIVNEECNLMLLAPPPPTIRLAAVDFSNDLV